MFTTADAAKLGYEHRAIRRAVDRGEWVRLRRGAYVMASTWRSADAVARHLLIARAVVRPMVGQVALSHTTAALALGVEAWNPGLGTVHVTRLDGRRGGHEHGVTHHETMVAEAQCRRVIDDDGEEDADFLVVPATHAVAGAMLLHGLDQSVVMADSALQRELVASEPLAELAESWRRMPESRHVRLATRLMDGRSESPGETLGRLVFWRGGLPRPELQMKVEGPLGSGRVRRLRLGGAGRGRRVRRQGQVPPQLPRGRARRATSSYARSSARTGSSRPGCIVRRMTWAELFTPNVVVTRFRRALAARSRVLV